MTDDDTAPAAAAPKLDFDPVPALVETLGLPAKGVAAVIALLDEGNTVPFIARYRKERTGGLDEVQIRAIEENREYLVELETRRAVILASVGEQDKLTPELEAKLRAATGKAELEDLYAPYRPRRKTRASVARERGLEPLAHRILAQGADGDPAGEAAAFVNETVKSTDEALAGARDIVAEMVADTAEVRTFVRNEYAEHGQLSSTVVPGKGDEPTKFEQYYQFEETVKTIPSHRFLAIRRGEAEGVLRAHVAVDIAGVEAGILRLVKHDPASPWGAQLELAVTDALKRLLAPSVENDVRGELKARSDHAAVDIFAGNLRNLMLAAPLGGASVIGVDPGLRTGCKCAAIDATGKFLGTVTIYISQGDAQLAKAKDDFIAFVREHKPRAIAVGNGTGGREAESFVKKTLGDGGLREGPDAPFVVQVNEAGASVYSASDLAREEFPELDLTIRGAISIARRLQDPLAELVKIEPKSIGVGQYQHDVHQPLLVKKLGDVVESCVNHIGVELNTASAQLLSYVAGIGKSLAKKIVLHRDTNGAFTSRGQLTDVSGLGPKAFEQAAGFLRIHGAGHALDASAVHPERYSLVEQMASELGVPLPELIGNQELVDKIDLSKYVQDDVGEPTLRDIASELGKPGRDPRAEFAPPKFRDDVTTMEDLKVGMVLEGIVTNVTAFGAFVDIGVHNDGLVHVSQLAEKFVKDPSEVVKVGQKLTVRVLEVDNQRKRIALSARPPQQRQQNQQRGGQNRGPRQQQQGGGGGEGLQQGRGPRGQQGGGQSQGRGPQGRGQGQGQGQGQHGQGPRNDRGPRADQRGPRNDERNPRADGPRHDGEGGHPEGANQDGLHVDGAVNNGALNDGALNDGALHGTAHNDGTLSNGTLNDGALNGGAVNDGAVNDGAVNDGAVNDGAANDGRRNDGRRNDGRRNDGSRNYGQRFDGQGNQGQGNQGQGNQGQGNQGQGNQGQGQGNQGNQGQGNWAQGNPNQGNQNRGQNQGRGNPNQGNQNRGQNQGRGHQGQGNWNQGNQGNQGQGNQGQGNWNQGNQGNWNQGNQGNQGQGNWNQGNQGQGNQGQGNWNQGNQGQGNQGQGNWNQGNQGQGNQGQGNQGQGNQGQGNQGRGNQGQGNQGQGNWNQGNQGQGNQGNQGNQNQGNDAARGNFRGPRNDGPRNNFRGPRNEGPRNDGPRNDGPRNDGPRNDGPRNDGPRNDGPRRDDRGPRRDDRGGPRNDGPPPENWGVSGFTNSPFSKLKPDKNDGSKR